MHKLLFNLGFALTQVSAICLMGHLAHAHESPTQLPPCYPPAGTHYSIVPHEVGYRCQTPKGFIYQLVAEDGLHARIWLDEASGVYWADPMAAAFNFNSAKRFCERLNSMYWYGSVFSLKWDLPSAPQYREAIQHEILRPRKDQPAFESDSGILYFMGHVLVYWTGTQAESFEKGLMLDIEARGFRSEYRSTGADVICSGVRLRSDVGSSR